ncbi:MAG TPA: divalent-cation tolerance protein CutA [Pirellulales bacterium]|nr:divalent-cation tolerance protein CutA [Pirellulales bacterium]
MTDYCMAMTTIDSAAGAERLAAAIVERQLAACVQVVGPITSTYRWQGCVERAEEWLCLFKTRRDAYLALETAIGELHSYETPEIIAVPLEAGSAAYLRWIDENTVG